MEAPEGTVEVLYPRSEAEAKAKAKAKAEADAEAEAEQEEKYPPRRRKAGNTAPATNWRGVVDYQRHRAPSLEAGVEPVPPDVAAKVKGNNFWFNVRALAGCKSSDLRRIANEYAVGSPEQQAADTDKPCRGNALSIVLLGCESYDRLVILNGIIAAALDRQRGTPPFYACRHHHLTAPVNQHHAGDIPDLQPHRFSAHTKGYTLRLENAKLRFTDVRWLTLDESLTNEMVRLALGEATNAEPAVPLVSPARAVLNDMRVDVALIVLRNTTSEEGLRHYIDMAQSLDDVPYVFVVAQAFPLREFDERGWRRKLDNTSAPIVPLQFYDNPTAGELMNSRYLHLLLLTISQAEIRGC
jgi:hypothetical protein